MQNITTDMNTTTPDKFIFFLSPAISNRELRILAQKNNIKYTTKKKTIEKLQAIADCKTLLEKQARIEQNDDCAICLEPLEIDTIAITRCKHAFCTKCIFKYILSHDAKCPMCRARYTTMMMVMDKMISRADYLMRIERIPFVEYEQTYVTENSTEFGLGQFGVVGSRLLLQYYHNNHNNINNRTFCCWICAGFFMYFNYVIFATAYSASYSATYANYTFEYDHLNF
jgi:hypothetical protein